MIAPAEVIRPSSRDARQHGAIVKLSGSQDGRGQPIGDVLIAFRKLDDHRFFGNAVKPKAKQVHKPPASPKPKS